MDVLFGKPPKMHRDTAHPAPPRWPALDTGALDLRDAALRVLAHPTVAAKPFLVPIGARSVRALPARDQMFGPWTLPFPDRPSTRSGSASQPRCTFGIGGQIGKTRGWGRGEQV